MGNTVRQRLIALGVEAVADALLGLAERSEAADAVVQRLVATPEENVQRFKAKLAGLKRGRRFIPWGEAEGLARQLEDMLHDLASNVDDPCQGAELVMSFYTTDNGTLGRCDDSSGFVGDVYRLEAADLFVGYASRCEKKERLAKRALKLVADDGYGVRDAILHRAVEYLPENIIRKHLIAPLEEQAESVQDEFEGRACFHLIESLALQLKDAPLFEKTRIASWGEPNGPACLSIARAYLDSGDARTALTWVERFPSEERFRAYERDQLLLEIHGRLGNRAQQEEAAWRLFRRHRSTETLNDLLSVIGEERRADIVADEVTAILDVPNLSESDAWFLIENNHMEEADTYLIERAEQLDGANYWLLLELVEPFEATGRQLAVTAIYRALLDSVLERGYTKAYSHAARYLKALDRIAETVEEWRGLVAHDTYAAQLRERHG